MQIYCKTKAELKKVLEFFKKNNINWRNKEDALKWGMDHLFAPVYIDYDPDRGSLTCCEYLDQDNDDVAVTADDFIRMNTIEEDPLEKKEEATKKEDIKVSIADFDKAANQLLAGAKDGTLEFYVIESVFKALRARLFFRRDEE